MACKANERSLLIGATVQAQDNTTALPTRKIFMHLTFICIDGPYRRPHDNPDDRDHESQGTHVCGNCKKHFIPSKQESDLERQLNLQRIQQQIELEDLQHKQRMNHLRTLLLS